MASAPAFASVPNNGSAQLSATSDSSYTAPSQAVTIFTAGANGSRVEEIIVHGTGTTVAGIVVVWRKNGGVFYVIDTFTVNVITPSTVQAPYRQARSYANLILKSGDTLVASSFTTSQLACVSASGGDF